MNFQPAHQQLPAITSIFFLDGFNVLLIAFRVPDVQAADYISQSL